LIIDGHDLQLSSVVRPSEMFEHVENWKAAMLEKGWRVESDGLETTKPDALSRTSRCKPKSRPDEARAPRPTEPNETEGG
jgi:hypothetical protein